MNHTALVAQAILDAFPRPQEMIGPSDEFGDAFAFRDPDVLGVLFVPKRDLLTSTCPRILVPVWTNQVVRALVQDAIETMDVSCSPSWLKFASTALCRVDDPNTRAICGQVGARCAWTLVTADAGVKLGTAKSLSYARAYRAHHLQRVRSSVASDGDGYGEPGRHARPAHNLDVADTCSRRRIENMLRRWSDGAAELDFDEVVIALMTAIYFNPERPDNMCIRARRQGALRDVGKSHSLRRVGEGLHMSPVELGFVTSDRAQVPTTLQDIADTVLEKVMWELRGPERAPGQMSLAAELLLSGGRERAARVVDRHLFEVIPKSSARDLQEYNRLQARVACYAFHFMFVTRDVHVPAPA